jgi:hypothetical protein
VLSGEEEVPLAQCVHRHDRPSLDAKKAVRASTGGL